MKEGQPKGVSRAFFWVISALAIFFIFTLVADETPVVLAVALLVGWAQFLLRVVPQIHVRWSMIFSALVYAILLIVGSHFFLKWLYSSATQYRWRWRWTLGGGLLFVVLFATGLSAVGIVDHTRQLITSTQPMFKPNRDRERANQAKCGSNLHQIGLAILLYQNDNAQAYPPDFSYLLRDEQITAPTFTCPSANQIAIEGPATQQAASVLTPGHCSYIYLGRGSAGIDLDNKAVAYEALENHNGEGIHVLFGDGHVDWLDRPQAVVFLDRLKAECATQPAPN